jgi:hypothetical protein
MIFDAKTGAFRVWICYYTGLGFELEAAEC